MREHVKRLVLEVLPEYLEAPAKVEREDFIRYWDMSTGDVVRASALQNVHFQGILALEHRKPAGIQALRPKNPEKHEETKCARPGDVVRDEKSVPAVFGKKDARIAIVLRFGRHQYVPLLLIFCSLADRYSVRVEALHSTLSPQPSEVFVRKGDEEDLKKLAETIFSVTKNHLETTFGWVL